MPVRLLLLLHHGDAGEAAFLQNAGHGPQAGTVEGGIHDGYVLVHRIPGQQHGFLLDPLDEGGIHVLADPGDGPAAQTRLKIAALHALKIVQLLDLGKDRVRRLGGDLAAVRPIHLVAVVLAGVVAGGDHHARGAAQRPHGIAQAGGGHQSGIDVGPDAVGGKHVCGDPGKQVGMDAAVIADGDAARFGREALDDVICQSLGSPGHGIHVHPVGAGAQHAPQAAGAEFQVPVEGVLDPGLVACHAAQLLPQLFLPHAAEPGPISIQHFFCYHYGSTPFSVKYFRHGCPCRKCCFTQSICPRPP